MADYLNMSLDSIISSNKNKIGNFANSSDFNDRNSVSTNSSRNSHKVARSSKQQIDKMSTSTNSSRSNSRALPRQSAKNLISIKFLISNELSGSMIGPGGAAIKELMDLTSARASVSASWETFPGTTDRIMLITGRPEEVIAAQYLVWDNVSLHASEDGFDGRVMWSPKKSQQRQLEGLSDNVVITGKVTIPSAAGGLIIGRSGATIRSFAERSGACVQINVKEDSLESHERVLVIAGPKKSCSDCLAMIIEKLVEGGSEFYQYEEDHHMEMMTNPASHSGRGGNRSREDRGTSTGRPPRRVTVMDSRSQSPSGRSRGSRDSREGITDNHSGRSSRERGGGREHRGNDRDRRDDRDSYGEGESEGKSVGWDVTRALHTPSAPDPIYESHAHGSYVGGFISAHNSTSSSQGRVSNPSIPEGKRTVGGTYVNFSPPLGPDFNNSRIQRIVKGGNNNSQAGIPLRTKSQDKSVKDGAGSGVVEVLSANTTINVAVPDALIGSVFGKQSVTLHEIIAFSGAHVVVSPRGQYIEGTTNRLVTITGSPQNAQTAHALISKALNQGDL